MKGTETAQKWASAINVVTIGATPAEGGTRSARVSVGGANCIPWLSFEGDIGNRPALAVEIWDSNGETWAGELKRQYGDAVKDPVKWAKKAAELGPDMICVKFMGTHPELGNRGPDESVAVLKGILAEVKLPLIVWGCGIEDKDNVVLPRLSEAAKGENCLFGTIKEKNYRTLVAACLADGHKILAESPLDINIAKQVNILAHDAGFPLENIVMFPSTTCLGYGFEYVYSIMERSRTTGLGGDPLLKQPILCDVGTEAWRAKEAQATDDLLPGLGPAAERGPLWETLTATNFLQSGVDILNLRHPKAVEAVRKAIDRLVAGAKASAS